MSEPFIGEIRMFSSNTIPRGWSPCNGQILAIATNQALFSLLGTTYGGNGVTTFGLPNLQGRVPVHTGNGVVLGQMAGEAQHTLLTQEIASHWHQLVVSTTTTGGDTTPFGNVLGATAQVYANPAPAPDSIMSAQTVGLTGNNQPHNNLMPSETVNICIALQGIFPQRS